MDKGNILVFSSAISFRHVGISWVIHAKENIGFYLRGDFLLGFNPVLGNINPLFVI